MVAIIFTVLAPDVPGEYKHDYDGYSEHLQEKLVSEQFLLDLRVLLALDKSLTFDSIQILYTDQEGQPTAAPSSIAGSETDAASSSSSAGMSELSIALVSMAVVSATAIVIIAVYYSYSFSRKTEVFRSPLTISGETDQVVLGDL